MADIKFSGGDMVIENGDVSIVTGQEAIGQHIEMRLRTWLGETVYDQAAGVPYLQVIFRKSTPIESIEAIIKQQVLDTPGVTGVDLTLTADSSSRELTVTGTATTIDGDVDFDVSLTANQTETAGG